MRLMILSRASKRRMTSALAKITREILSEYATHMGTGHCRLVPLSVWEALVSQLCAVEGEKGGQAARPEGLTLLKDVQAAMPEGLAPLCQWRAELVEPLFGNPICVADIKGRARELAALRENDAATPATTPFLIADVRRFGCELSPACRLGARLAVDADPGFPGFVVVGIAKHAHPQIAEVVETAAVDADSVQAAPGSDEAREARRTSRHRANDAAAVIAAYLRAHPKVVQLRYPGLKDTEQFKIASTQLIGGFGPIIDVQTQDQPGIWRRLEANDTDPKQQILKLAL